jgi:uncharacterized pyridoxamine 5'-phosphate oxidase family protein
MNDKNSQSKKLQALLREIKGNCTEVDYVSMSNSYTMFIEMGRRITLADDKEIKELIMKYLDAICLEIPDDVVQRIADRINNC